MLARRRSGLAQRRMIGLAAALWLQRTGTAVAFPLIDPTNQDQVPYGTELAKPDALELQHQLQIVNGSGAPRGGGWTFVPRIDIQEMLTDNVAEQHSPRRADLISYFAPGFSLVGDRPRLQITLNYAPTLAIYSRTGSLDSLTQQLNALGVLTLAPEFAYVDVRALSGVRNLYGGLGGIGTIGSPAGDEATAETAAPLLAGNAAGLKRNNEVQTTSFAVSPYLLHEFGDWGTGKVGYALGITRSNTLSGFVSPPFPAGGVNGQTLLTNEEIAHLVTGNVLAFLRNSIDLDMLQGRTTTDSTGTAPAVRLSALPAASASSRVVASDTVSYPLTRDLLVFAMGGHEDISYSNQTINNATAPFGAGGIGSTPNYVYSGAPGLSIHDLIWNLGGTWTPGPDSSLTLAYGHHDGFNAFSANGHYQVSARTALTASYGSTLGTQLEYLQNQLNLAATNGAGALVDARTGGPLFGTTNTLAVRDGLFRTDSLSVGARTVLERDIVALNLVLTKQTSSGNGAITGLSRNLGGTWLHEMRPNMTVSGTVSLATQDQTTTFAEQVHAVNLTSIVANLVWQYRISETLKASVRYSFLAQMSPTPAYGFYQNILILGLTKTF